MECTASASAAHKERVRKMDFLCKCHVYVALVSFATMHGVAAAVRHHIQLETSHTSLPNWACLADTGISCTFVTASKCSVWATQCMFKLMQNTPVKQQN